jgi:hypothetical protein
MVVHIVWTFNGSGWKATEARYPCVTFQIESHPTKVKTYKLCWLFMEH